MDDANLNRMFELIQQEFVRSRAEMQEFRVEVNARFDQVALRAEMNQRFDAMRVEMTERDQSVVDRLTLLEQTMGKFTRVVEEMRVEVSAVKIDVLKLDNRFDKLQQNVNGLADDMRQRFRTLNERLSGV
ncbi:MAG: hypothetical protein ACT4O1_01270 [Gemmatimonadota bacterium]